ncbi:hypothetical protein [Jidongwangia harbinensis]|uniref:hypothetical protein n=1 Tax=Jidongwangia harbinensis TaxID=2878561 RepID=UPI001CD92E45|nr:hypothetical protein [Jidongwangia harbinensis]MCA2213321.1 hypothetical protein [Jidongwangia harbinensis]
MDLTSTDILFGLGAVAAAVFAACGVYWASGRGTAASPRGPLPPSPAETVTSPPAAAEPAPAAPAPQPRAPIGLDPHGRHRAPEELLRASTYRLTADRIARAKVQAPDQRTQSSQAIPSPSRSRS